MNCRYCEKEFPEDELVAVGAVGAEGEVACKSCEELHTGQCESCDKVLDMGCLVSVNDGSTLLCRGCMEVEAYECEWCEHLYTEAYSHRTADINCCEACTDRHYFWCDSCDGYYCIDDSGDHDHDNEYSEGEGTWEAPYSYDYEPCWEFHRAPHEQDTSTYFGVELEVARGKGTIDWRVPCPPWAVYKHDGSVHNGAELVSSPFSLAWYQETGAEQFRTLMKSWKRCNLLSGERVGAGMHVHVSRSAFEDARHLYRFLRLFYRHPGFTTKLSRRTEGDLDRWASLNTSLMSLARKAVSGTMLNPGRYTAINLSNRHTVEVRIFTGTVNFFRFDHNLRTVMGAVEFTRSMPSTKHCTLEAFAAWLEGQDDSWHTTAINVRRCAELPSRKVAHA